MTEFCIICFTELGCTDPTGWVIRKDGNVVCPWCIKEKAIEDINRDLSTFT